MRRGGEGHLGERAKFLERGGEPLKQDFMPPSLSYKRRGYFVRACVWRPSNKFCRVPPFEFFLFLSPSLPFDLSARLPLSTTTLRGKKPTGLVPKSELEERESERREKLLTPERWEEEEEMHFLPSLFKNIEGVQHLVYS